jgi:amino acid permease
MLSEKIWITRKARINTERRLLRKNTISQVLMIYYSTILVLVSLLSLIYPNSDLSLVSLIGSIVVLIASVTLYAQRYMERALAMRRCYIKLDDIFGRVKKAEESEGGVGSEFQLEYNECIGAVENHSEYDYLCLRITLRNDSKSGLPQVSKADLFKYFVEKGWRVLICVACFILPLVVAISYPWYMSYVGK